jgi:hypothetical protein
MQVLGRATIKYNGNTLLTDKGAKLNMGGVERKAVEGDTVHGYAEEVKAPFIDCNISLRRGASLQAIVDITDATVTFEADTGQVYTLTNAWSSVPPEITAGDGGKVPVKFYGMKCDEITA